MFERYANACWYPGSGWACVRQHLLTTLYSSLRPSLVMLGGARTTTHICGGVASADIRAFLSIIWDPIGKFATSIDYPNARTRASCDIDIDLTAGMIHCVRSAKNRGTSGRPKMQRLCIRTCAISWLSASNDGWR
ncbi:Protein of unknown function [Pyronema omphalodes CBS 100304]|uniref:Uncharacterized protein n=1 Tax=Pyronema omphalodes (strain CBS 100304) TaxID=1076935 RepID=U4LRH4_PYROM|nr:Protein of unknown function [Pyronema omphalodes CBS 100304]